MALLLPQIAILLRQELDATYALAPPQWQQVIARRYIWDSTIGNAAFPTFWTA